MRHADRGLLQDEALRRREDVGPSPERLPRQGQEVELGVEPSQAEPEAAFSLRGTVAGTLVATAASERRDHLRPEVDRRFPGEILDPHASPPLETGVPDHQRGLARPARRDQALGGDRRDRRVEDLVSGERRQVRLQVRAMTTRDLHSLGVPAAVQDELGGLHRDRLDGRSTGMGTGASVCECHERNAHRHRGDRRGRSRARAHYRPPFGATTTTSIGLPATGSSNFPTLAEPANAMR